MRININGSCIYDDIAGIGLPIIEQTNTWHDEERLLNRVLPEFMGIVGVTSILASVKPTLVFAADASTRLLAKETSIIHLLQSIATPAAIAIALWGLLEWAVMGLPQGKKKIWESLWLLLGIKFIPDIWMTIAG